MKIYIDTNWFLSFYQSNHERQNVLENIAKHAELVVMTEQNLNEFRRNRTALLIDLRSNVAKSTKIAPYTTSLR
jgi:predicted nucleic acid-binding protein